MGAQLSQSVALKSQQGLKIELRR